MSTFSKNLLGKNIKYLAEKKNIKIGEVEQEVGVSVGYLSRISKESNGVSLPFLDVIFEFSKKLNVSIDSLFNIDYEKLSSNELYLSDFFNEIIDSTKNEKILWRTEGEKELKNVSYMSQHPLYFKDYVLNEDTFIFDSKFKEVKLNNQILKTNINNQIIYLLQTCIKEKIGYEMYFYNEELNELTPLSDFYDEDRLYNLITQLYDCAKISSESTYVSKNARTIIDGIMNKHKAENDFDVFYHNVIEPKSEYNPFIQNEKNELKSKEQKEEYNPFDDIPF